MLRSPVITVVLVPLKSLIKTSINIKSEEVSRDGGVKST